MPLTERSLLFGCDVDTSGLILSMKLALAVAEDLSTAYGFVLRGRGGMSFRWWE